VEDLVKLLEQIEPVLAIVARIGREYVLLIATVVLLILLLRIVKKWPDRAKRAFQRAGIRVSNKKVEELRLDLANITANAARQGLQNVTGLQVKIENIRHERKKVKHLVRASPLLVKEVGKALVALEREYKTSVKKVKSESAREVLRCAAEKGMSDILQSLNSTPSKLPSFDIYERSDR